MKDEEESSFVVEASVQLVDRYEELRSASSGRRHPGRGLALLLGQGMASWMHAWSSLAGSDSDRSSAAQVIGTRRHGLGLHESLVSGDRAGVVGTLTTMAIRIWDKEVEA